MALNHLTIGEMVNSTSAWVEADNPVRDAFLQVLPLATLLPKVEDAHNQLLRVQRVNFDRAMAQLVDQRAGIDHRYDWCARSIHAALDCHIFLARAMGRAESERTLVATREVLFPYGLEVVNYSYAEEAGQAHLLASRMTPTIEQTLSALPMPGGTLLELVNQWIATGIELGDLEADFADMERPSQRGPVARARVDWMRAILAVRSVARLEDSLPLAAQQALTRIEWVEEAARRRLAAQNADSADDAVDAEPGEDAGADAGADIGADIGEDAGADIGADIGDAPADEPAPVVVSESGPEPGSEPEPGLAPEFVGAGDAAFESERATG